MDGLYVAARLIIINSRMLRLISDFSPCASLAGARAALGNASYVEAAAQVELRQRIVSVPWITSLRMMNICSTISRGSVAKKTRPKLRA